MKEAGYAGEWPERRRPGVPNQRPMLNYVLGLLQARFCSLASLQGFLSPLPTEKVWGTFSGRQQ